MDGWMMDEESQGQVTMQLKYLLHYVATRRGRPSCPAMCIRMGDSVGRGGSTEATGFLPLPVPPQATVVPPHTQWTEESPQGKSPVSY